MASMKIIFAQVFSNLTWKMASLMMAIGLWVVIRVAVVEENEASRADQGLIASREFTEVPIIVQTSSTDTNRYVIEPQTVQVKLEGQAKLLESADASRIRVVADFTRQSGENEFAVTLAVEIPPEFELKYCEPQSIRVEKAD